MMRPRLRPTLSRRNKYIGIAPRAERKLEKEARRGSFDLRRLVGHANFLDILVDTLGGVNEETESALASLSDAATAPKDAGLEGDEGDASSDGSWSDSSDDDDQVLTRTASKSSLVDRAKITLEDTKAAIVSSGDDYFNHTIHGEPTLTMDDLSLAEEVKNAGLTVSVVSPLSNFMGNGESEGGSSTSVSPGGDEVLA